MARHTQVTPSRPFLLVSVDTEEDQWGPGFDSWSTRNIHALPKAHQVFREAGVRATYFTSYRVALDPEAAAILRELAADGDCEIGAHLHPWNTPPVEEAGEPRDSMLRNLPEALQARKLRTLTDRLETAFGERPTSFRAGRLGLGPETVNALIGLGYAADSSVAPFLDWTSLDEGPDFMGAPNRPYRLGRDGDIRVPRNEGELLEIPLSSGYTCDPYAPPARLHRRLETLRVRGLPLSAILSRTGVVRKVVLSPEFDSTEDMLALARALLDSGVPHLHLVFHSSTLLPGATPFAATRAEADRILDSVKWFLERVRKLTDVLPATVGECAQALSRARHSRCLEPTTGNGTRL